METGCPGWLSVVADQRCVQVIDSEDLMCDGDDDEDSYCEPGADVEMKTC